MSKVYLTTPSGEVAIVKSKVLAVMSCNVAVQHSDKTVLCQVYVDGSEEPFNIMEDFQYVTDNI